MRHTHTKYRLLLSTALLLGTVATAHAVSPAETVFWQSSDTSEREDYVRVPMPPGIQVIQTELDGPVFATADGKTLYQWPLGGLRNGSLGDRKNSGGSTCGDTVYQETSGLMSPYPPGFLLPDLDKRRSCQDVWPPLFAEGDAKPVGKWELVDHPSGKKMWAYDGYPVYTSILDKKQGDVLGGTRAGNGGEAGVLRTPVGPPANVPPEMGVLQGRTGRLLVNHKNYAVYASKNDGPNKSNCFDECLNTWAPVLAPLTAKPNGEWTIVERSPGIKQWAYRAKPLYTYIPEQRTATITGVDVPGWEPVFTQRALLPPAEFTVQDGRIGQVLADANGKSIYYYSCNDDAMDQQACDHPAAPQAYRMAVCGNFDAKRCLETFPYVKAAANAQSASSLWTVMTINENTGEHASPGEPGAIQVWAYRERPVYTFGRDEQPGETNGESWGEFNGARNGFKAFWVRDDYRSNVYGRR